MHYDAGCKKYGFLKILDLLDIVSKYHMGLVPGFLFGGHPLYGKLVMTNLQIKVEWRKKKRL